MKDYERGYNEAMRLMKNNTYMYDSTRRLFEVSKLSLEYENETQEYKRGFVSAVYDMFRC